MTTARWWRWWAAGAGALLATGCMGHGRGMTASPEAANVSSAQQSSEQALNDAAVAQREAQDAQARAEAAHQAVLEARQRLTYAEAEYRRTQVAAEDAQARARQRSQAAAAEVSADQQQALDAQRAETRVRTEQSRDFHQDRAEATGHQQLLGTLTRAGSDSVEIQAPDRRQISLAIDDDTDVRLNGQPTSADQLPQGADVRAAYDLRDGKATATRIDVTSTAVAPQERPQAAPGRNDTEPPPAKE